MKGPLSNNDNIDYLVKKSVRNTTTVIAMIFSVIISLTVLTQLWETFKKNEELKITQVETIWAEKILCISHMCNILAQQPELFSSEESIQNVLKHVYLEYFKLIAYPAFGTVYGKMITYPKYDYPPEYDPRSRPWYRLAISNPKNVVITPPFIHGILKEPTIAVVKAVYNSEGKFLGVLGFDIVASRISENILPDKAYIVDSEGTLVAKKGEISAIFSPKRVKKGEGIYFKTTGLTHYVAKESVAGTYIVVEHSLMNHIIPTFLPVIVLLTSILTLGYLVSKKLVTFLSLNISKPIEEIVNSVRNYLLGKKFSINLKSEIREIDLLQKEFSAMVETIDTQMEEVKESYKKLETVNLQLEELIDILKEKDRQITETYHFLTERLAMVVEAFDEPTGKHVKRVRLLSKFFAEKIGLPEEKIFEIELFAPLHDIGKIFLPKDLLTKPGRLTPDEFELVKQHTKWGAELLSGDEKLKIAYNIALYHHEKYDGTGYPFGLKADEIPIEAQIVSIVDVYDALRSDRPYKKALTHEEAVKIILEGDEKTKPDHFSPKLLEILRQHLKEIDLLWNTFKD
ncbi:MAG: HD domain-containing protein [Fervidobacterium sp.]|nr:HD domain-containing protein [Fervidobacterium sp.]